MRRVMSWLAERLSSCLHAHEREAVGGDAEERGTAITRDVLSVILWRQWQAWVTSGPWLALLLVVLPLGFVLSLVSRYWAARMSLYLWLYGQNWTAGYLASRGAWLDLLGVIAATGTDMTALVLWSWTIGCVLALLSRRASGVNGLLFATMVFAGTGGTTTIGIANPTNAAVFSSAFYRIGVPFAARVLLVMVPLWRGMRAGCDEGRPSLWWTAGRTLAATLLVGLTFKGLTGALLLGWISPTQAPGFFGAFWWARFQAWSLLLLPLFPLAMAWPPAYLLIRARRQRQFPKTASAG
jgi:hypothetical protein